MVGFRWEQRTRTVPRFILDEFNSLSTIPGISEGLSQCGKLDRHGCNGHRVRRTAAHGDSTLLDGEPIVDGAAAPPRLQAQAGGWAAGGLVACFFAILSLRCLPTCQGNTIANRASF